jgi:recombination protein RecA
MGRTKGAKGKKNKQIPLSEESKKLVEKGLQEAKEGKLERINLDKELKKEEVNPNLKRVTNELTKQFGHEVIHFASEEPERERIPTGIPELDKMIKGFPSGAFSVIWGNKGSTKSTTALYLIAQAQKLGKTCLYLDLETSFDNEWADKCGIDRNKLLIGHFDNAEQALDTAIKMSKEKVIDVIILDSVQSLSPEGEQETKKGEEKSTGDDTMALLARRLSQFFRMDAAGNYKGNVTFILIGQSRMDLGGYIKLEKLSGGKCFPIDTRILTKNGLKFYNEVNVGDLIPTINLKNKKIQYKPIKNIYFYDFNGELNQFINKYGIEFLFTNNHKCLVKKFKWDKKRKNSFLNGKFYTTVNASETRRTFAFPISFPSGNRELKIKDDEIKLLGWILTDGSVNKANEKALNWRKSASRIIIYQSKERYVKEIEQILKRLNYSYKKTKRNPRDKREEFKNTKPSYVFYLYNAKKLLKKYQLTDDRKIPDYLFNLSDRQAIILFNEMLKGDGTRKKETQFPSYIVDGNKYNIERLAHFLVTHNINISYIKKHKNAYYLLLKQHDYIGFDIKKKKKYNGKIWDISVDNELHFIERNGQLIATHNSLQHWATLIIKAYRATKADAPTYKFKIGDKNKSFPIGFEICYRLEKKKISGTAPEETEVRTNFYNEFGFRKPSDKEIENLYADWIEMEKE